MAQPLPEPLEREPDDIHMAKSTGALARPPPLAKRSPMWDSGGMLHTDVTGAEVTVAPAAAAAWDHAVEGWLTFAADVLERVEAVLDVDAGMVAAHVLYAWLLHQSHDPQNDDAVESSLGTAARHSEEVTDRERRHLRAVTARISGDPRSAAAAWEETLGVDRCDLVALRCAYFDHYENGDIDATCRTAVRSLDAWSDDDRWYPVVQGMSAFALSEIGESATAERMGREAAERAPWDLWSLHAVAHVLEDGGRPLEGARWLGAHAEHLPDVVGFARHLWWHQALFSLAGGDTETALALYDGPIGAGGGAGHLDLTNLISLLARLEMSGIDVGDRWEALVEASRGRIEHRRSLFVHAHVALAHSWGPGGDPDAVLHSTVAWAASDALAAELGVPLVRAVLDWRPDGTASPPSLDQAAASLLPRLGGSGAQRTLFEPLVRRLPK